MQLQWLLPYVITRCHFFLLLLLLTLTFTLPLFSYHFPYFSFSASLFLLHPFLIPVAVSLHYLQFRSAKSLYESVSDSPSAGLPLVICAGNREQNGVVLGSHPQGEGGYSILHCVNLLLFRQADFYFRLCRFPPLRHFYCIIRRQGQQWSGLTVWARPVSPPSSSSCVMCSSVSQWLFNRLS